MRPLTGYIADAFLGAVNTFILAAAFLGVSLFVWIGVFSTTGMYVFAVLFGLANGCAQGVWIACLAALTRDTSKIGTRFGMVCTIAAFATLAGPPTASGIISATGVYTWAQLWAGTVIILGCMAIIGGRTCLVGKKLWVKI